MTALVDQLPNMLLAWGVLVVGLLIPGPSVMLILSTASARGRRAGVMLAFGVACGTGAWALLTAFGLAALIHDVAWAANAMRYVGAAYLAYLAVNAWRQAGRTAPPPRPAAKGDAWKLWAMGLGFHLTNPKAGGFWLAIATMGIGGVTEPVVLVSFVVGSFLISLSLNSAWASLFSAALFTAWMARARRGIQTVLGALFGAASLQLLLARG